MSTLLTRREQFHRSRIVEHLQNMNPAYPDYANQVGNMLGSGPDTTTTLAGIYSHAVQQATLLSYLDEFKIVGMLSLALLPELLLVKPGKGGAAQRPRSLIDRRSDSPPGVDDDDCCLQREARRWMTSR